MVYTQYGGSGLGMSYADAMEIDFNDALWFARKLNETRENEAEQLSKAR